MSNKTISNEKTTIYLDPRVKKSVQYYALHDDKSMSEIINERLFAYLEDRADIMAADEARNDGEEAIPFKQAVKELGLDFNEIRRQAKAEVSKTA